MVMGGDSRCEGRGFESQCRLQEGHYFTSICCKIVVMFFLKKTQYKRKEAGVGQFFFKKKS